MKFKIPDTLILVLSVLIIFLILTWILPAGEYDRRIFDGREIIVPDSYKRIDPQPQGLGAFLTAPIKGFISASQIIAFVLIIGGAFSIINKTGAIEAGLNSIIRYSIGKKYFRKALIAFLMVLFSIAGATFGMSEEVLVFILITIPLSLSLGYDSIIGISIPLIGAGAGFAGAVTNPFTIGVAQGIAELPLFSGWEYRIVVWFFLTTIATVYVIRYASRLEKNNTLSPVFDIDSQRSLKETQVDESCLLTPKRKFILLFLVVGMIGLIVGVSRWHWYINEISGLFLALGIITALIYRLKSSEAAEAFVYGAKDMISAALVIALSKGVLLVATEGKIIDTILYSVSQSVEGFHPVISAQMMYIVQSIIHFFVPSGSGQAALTMPIMSPLSDLIHISRQTTVLIFQLGDGINSMIIPTSGVTMGVLAIAKIPYSRWVKWVWPLMVILFVAAMLLLVPPVMFFEWGPH